MAERAVESSAGIFADLNEKEQIRVLHVDDDSSFLDVAKQCLEVEGSFQVDTAFSVGEALEKMKSKTYDVIISDYQMPGKDGLGFLKELRQEGNTIPFIMFTGKGREEVAVRALNLGANQYLNKAGDPETVYAGLAQCLREAVRSAQVLAERKETEKIAEKSERKYRSLFSAMSEGVCFHEIVYDESGKAVDYIITDVNSAFESITGIRKEEAVRCKASELYGTGEPPYLEVYAKVAESGEPTSFETYFTPMKKHFGISVFSLAKGMFATVFCDVTERMKAEEEAKKTSEEWGRTFDAITDLVFIIDMENRLVKVNKSVCDFLKKKPQELIGKFCYEVVHGTQEPWPNCPHRKTLETKKPATAEVNDPNIGRPLWVTISPVYDERGEFVQCLHVAKDITELKKAEQELRRFSTSVKASLDGIVTGDLNGNIADVNEAALGMYGSPDKSDLIGKNVNDFIVKRDRERALQNAMESIRTGQGKTAEYSVLTKNGTEIPVEITTALVRDEQNELIGFVDIIRNLAERKKTEEALRRSEEKLRAIVTSSPDAISVLDLNGNVNEINEAALKLHGFSDKEEILGQSSFDYVVSRDRSRAREFFENTVREGGVRKSEFTLLTVDGCELFTEVSANVVRDANGKPLCVVIATKDVTERKRAELGFAESQEKFAALFSGNPEATVYIDTSMNILDVNFRFTSLFGYSLEEVRGKKLADTVVPQNLIKEGKMLDKKAGDGYVYHDTVRMRKDGSLIPVSVSAAPISIQGQLVGYIGVYKDTSRQKSAETKLAMMNEKLRVIGGLTRHDVRNKLSVITGNTYLNKKKLQDHPEMIESFKDIESACELIVRIFDFARDYERLGVEELTYVDVEDSVQKAASLFANINGTKMVNDCHGLTVLADSLMTQLYYNLIDNSLKYGSHVKMIKIRYEESEGQLRLIYEDDGVGISQEAKLKLFQEGYTTGKGSGYGLYLIKKMMEVYGWTIQEIGMQGKGAQFVVTIPRTTEQGKENYRTR